MDKLRNFINWKLKTHIGIGIFIRMLFIVYGIYHDKNYLVQYTDIDYNVFTDAARHVYNGESPYKRHTYRYSPLIAYFLTPNIFLNDDFGKVLFSIFDILITVSIKKLVQHQLGKARNASKIATYCALFWIYNPMSIGISTRGNADSLPCFFLILSLLFLQCDMIRNIFKYVLSGILLGFSIHLRLYPLILSFPMYLSLGEYRISRKTKIQDGLWSLFPNRKQIYLTISCIVTLYSLTHIFYLKYGYEFLFETYVYHLFRKDIRHNFSVLFYYSYITKDFLSVDFVKTILQVFQFIVLFILSLAFGIKPETLPFALFCQTVVLVIYNSVMTSQYFIWFLSLLPLIIHCFKIKPAKALVLLILWVITQGGWLYFAYLLEFKSKETFIFIWMQGIMFFCVNIYILVQLINSYKPNHCFGLVVSVESKKL